MNREDKKEQFNLPPDQFDLPRKKITEELSEAQLEAYREGRLKDQIKEELRDSYSEGKRVGGFFTGLILFILLLLWFLFN